MMKRQTIDKVVKSLNRSIQVNQKRLIYQLELKAEANLQNGNLKVKDKSYMSNIMKYELILADLASVKRAIIKKGTKEVEVEVKIYGTAENGGYVYPEFTKALAKAKLDMGGDGYGTIWLRSIEEMEEEWAEEERMAMQLNGLMAEFED